LTNNKLGIKIKLKTKQRYLIVSVSEMSEIILDKDTLSQMAKQQDLLSPRRLERIQAGAASILQGKSP
jgi:hypothetical protein